MPIPPRRLVPAPRPPQPPPPEQPEQPEDAAPADDTPDESYLAFGQQAQERIKVGQEANAPRGYREFFVTKAEVAAAKTKGEVPTVRVHFVRNYAKLEENVSVPCCTIMVQGRPTRYTSAGDDCALAAAGVPVSIRPAYLLIDHRVYTKQDQTKGTDDLKLWIPPPNIMGIMQNAIKNLAENLGVDQSQVDITKHEAKLSKIGEGRSTTWAIDFVIQPRALSKTAVENITKAFGTDGVRKTLAKWLAPNPRYRISKGGTYVMPPRQPRSGGAPATDSDVPY